MNTNTHITQDDIDAALSAITRELSGMLDPLDIPTSWSARQLDAYEHRRGALRQRAHTIRSSWPSYCETLHGIAGLTAWRDQLKTWRARLEAELAQIPKQAGAKGDVFIDLSPVDLGRRQNLELSILTIDEGQRHRDLETLRLAALMVESGFTATDPLDGAAVGRLPWHGDMRNTERRLAELDENRRTYESHLADALLSDADREAKAIANAERLRIAREAPQRKRRGDGVLFDKYPDGRCVIVDESAPSPDTDESASAPSRDSADSASAPSPVSEETPSAPSHDTDSGVSVQESAPA